MKYVTKDAASVIARIVELLPKLKDRREKARIQLAEQNVGKWYVRKWFVLKRFLTRDECLSYVQSGEFDVTPSNFRGTWELHEANLQIQSLEYLKKTIEDSVIVDHIVLDEREIEILLDWIWQ